MSNKIIMLSALLSIALVVTSPVNASQQIVNGEFEIGALTGYWCPTVFDCSPWERFTWGGEIGNAWLTDGQGDNDLGLNGLISADDRAIKFRWGASGISQVFEVVEGVEYTFSADILNPSYPATATALSMYLKIVWIDADDNWFNHIGTGDAVWNLAIFDPVAEAMDQWVTISGSQVAPANAVKCQVMLISEGSGGQDNYIYVDNVKITAPIAADPSPVDGEVVSPQDLIELEWTNPETLNGPLTCEIYWSVNDSNNLSIAGAITDQNPGSVSTVDVSSLGITPLADTNYFWKVVIIDTGDSNAEYPGLAWSVSTTSAPPIVNAGYDKTLWLDSGSVDLTFQATATDDGLPNPPGEMTFTWSCDAASGYSVSDIAVLTPEVTFSEAGIYVFTLTVDDGKDQVTDDLVVEVLDATDSRLKALYEFESDAADSIGGHDGTLVGAVIDNVATNARLGSGSLLLSNADDRVEILDSGNGQADPNELTYISTWADFRQAHQFTISAWIQVDAFRSDWQSIMYKGATYGLNRNAGSSNLYARISQYPDNEISARDDDMIAIAIDDGNWHHIAAAFDGVNLSLYIDGILEAQELAADYNGSLPLDGSYLVFGNGLDGRLDQIRLYDRGLTADRIWDEFISDGGTNSCRQQYSLSDLNKDCGVDVLDLAIMASEWLVCSDLTDPLCD